MSGGKYWPLGLVGVAGLILWILGYRYPEDGGAITVMALLVVAGGGYLVLVEKTGRWK
jgi:hypothetical protein